METVAFLDTHLFVWLTAGEVSLISPAAQKFLNQATLRVSPMVLLEVDYLHEIKRVTMRGEAMFKKLAEEIPIEVANDSMAEICSFASRLSWTRDPFDRLIVAHASLHKAPLITKDRILHRHYSCVW